MSEDKVAQPLPQSRTETGPPRRLGPTWLPVPALVAAIAVTSGRAAAQRIAPLLLGISVASAVVFGGNGMDAKDLTSLCDRSRAVRAGLWGLWLLAATPAARALFGERSALLWRALPIPRWQHYAVTAGLLVLLELPMTILYGRGGVLPALVMTLFAIAAHSLLCDDGARPRTWALAGLLASAMLVPRLPVHHVALWLSAPLTVAIALPAAWRRAAARPLPRERPMVAGPATVALLLGHVAVLLRTQRPLLGRAVMFFIMGLCITCLALRNNHIQSPAGIAALSLLALAPCALLAASALAGPVLQNERTLTWLLLSTGTTGSQRVAAVHGAAMLLMAPLGLGYGTLVAVLQHGTLLLGLRLVLESLVCTLCAAGTVGALIRFAQRGDPRDGDRVLMVQLAVIPAGLVSAWALDELVLLLWLLGTAFLWGYALSLAAPLTRYGRLRRERADRNSNQVSA